MPEVYVQQVVTPEGEGSYAVVDGQQRIRTVLQFIGSESDPEEQEYNKFALDKIQTSSPWYGFSFSDLSDESKKRFYQYRLAVRFLNTESDEVVRDMFKRLNKFLTPLNAQELRNATYTGPFVALVQRLADDEYWTENRIVTPASIRRMKDVEFVSELVIGVLHGPQGGGPTVVDGYYEVYEDYEDEFPQQRKATKLFDATLKLVERIIPHIKETRWGNRTDFYTLFLTVAHLLRDHELSSRNITKARKALLHFEQDIAKRLANERARVASGAIDYVRAVQKGANDKKRRADRQRALLHVVGQFFRKR